MNITIFGAGGFIGTNIALKLARSAENTITLVGRDIGHFNSVLWSEYPNVKIIVSQFERNADFIGLVKNRDAVIHLASTLNPANSNISICDEVCSDLEPTAKLLDACVAEKVQRFIFASSGGTVYGKEDNCPINECHETNPINTYGLQKLIIEKMLGLYKQIYGLNYTVLRLANPYGPYQRPTGKLGAVAAFTYNAIHDREISVYGDGSVVRDYLYIGDAVDCVEKILFSEPKYNVYNIGSGKGTSLNELLEVISRVLGKTLKVRYEKSRPVDVQVNYLDVSRYEEEYGAICQTPFYDGIMRTCDYLGKLQ